MTAIYGQLFINKFGKADSNSIWYEALKELTPKALEMGMERLIKLSAGDKFAEYPPNCLQFKALCLAFYEDLRLPRASEAYREIINRNYCKNKLWSHPVVKLVANSLPSDFFEEKGRQVTNTEQEAYALFVKAYEQACNLIKQGHAIPDTQESPDLLKLSKVSNNAVARNHLQQIKQLLRASQ